MPPRRSMLALVVRHVGIGFLAFASFEMAVAAVPSKIEGWRRVVVFADVGCIRGRWGVFAAVGMDPLSWAPTLYRCWPGFVFDGREVLRMSRCRRCRGTGSCRCRVSAVAGGVGACVAFVTVDIPTRALHP